MITAEYFGTHNGKQVMRINLNNRKGISVSVLNYGATIQEINVLDQKNNPVDIVLGYETMGEYASNNGYLGAVVGRYGNRIANAAFTLNGKEYKLVPNEGPNQLHGGPNGFNSQVWDYKISQPDNAVTFNYRSVDGEDGFPGNLDVSVTYKLDDENHLTLTYHAVSDQDTIVNLTNHTYYNLSGQGAGSILKHVMMINADAFTPCGKGTIPTGEIRKVDGTPLDFRTPTPIGKRIHDPLLTETKGYDNNMVLNGTGIKKAAEVYSPETGIEMTCTTDLEGMQFYTGNFLTPRNGKDGMKYDQYSGFCMETQHFPDSINHPNFPSAVLRAGQAWETSTTFAFSIHK